MPENVVPIEHILRLSPAAVKAAQRLQRLKPGKAYDIMLIKREHSFWQLIIKTPEGMEIENCQ